ncbi:MAG: hypothetical protein B6U76_12190 [Desulfurococcales archaeon ex4484_217_2]|nr:MAG: hypothetical protein B6U76_12190 [Desulfurococcales archaeon ex4484_217_2]
MAVAVLLKTLLKIYGYRRLLAFAVLFAAFSATMLGSLGYVEALYSLYERSFGKTCGVVISGFSTTPYTSSVPVDYVEARLRSSGCGSAVFYEVITAPCFFRNTAVIVRGFSAGFAEREKIVFEGGNFTNKCLGCCWVGRGLAEKYGVEVGDVVVFYSPFVSYPVVSRVEGYVSGDPYSYEIIVPLEFARLIRGFSGKYASAIVVYPGSNCSKSRVAEVFGVTTRKIELLGRALILLQKMGGKVHVETYSSFYEAYVGRFGLGRNVFLAVAFSLTIASIVGSGVTGAYFVKLRRSIYRHLIEQGVSVSALKTCFTVVLTLLTLLSHTIAYALILSLPLSSPITVYNYPLEPILTLHDLALSYATVASSSILGGLVVKTG